MSMGSWYVIITKVYEQFKMDSQAQARRTSRSGARRRCVKGAEGLKKNSPYRFIAETGLEAIDQTYRPARKRST